MESLLFFYGIGFLCFDFDIVLLFLIRKENY